MLKKRLTRGLLVGGAAFLAAFALESARIFERLEWKSWDARMQAFADPGRADGDIVLILVDQYSLDFYEKQGIGWPWPRELYGAIVRHAAAGGAKAVFFDIAMTEGSRFGVEDDAALAAAMREAGVVVLPVFLSAEEGEIEASETALLRRLASNAAGKTAVPGAGRVSGDVFRSATLPIGEYLEAARGAANVRVNPDADNIYRRSPSLFTLPDPAGSSPIIVPSVPWALATIVDPSLDLTGIPMDEDGRMIIRFFGPQGTYRSLTAASVVNSFAQVQEGLEPQITSSEFAGKTVLLGLSAVGLYDIKASPLSGVVPGVEIQAAALDTVLNGLAFTRPGRAVTPLYVLALAMIAGFSLSFIRKAWINAAAFAGFLVLPAAVSTAAFAARLWLDFVFPASAVLLALIGATVLNYAVEGRERRFLKGVFHHYLSPAVIDRILEDPDRLRLGGEQREITSLFSDVAGFTSLSESLSPPELVALLNAYLTEMTDIILDAGGTLDKYEGDAIIAFWNAPLDDPDHALRAARAALACRRRIIESDASFKERFGRIVRMRIGLNTGPAVVGNMGSARRFDYTAIGDTVNLAARLESAGKVYGVGILAGEATAARMGPSIVSREVDRVRVVGKSRAVAIFELIGERGEVPEETMARLDAFAWALAVFREGRFDEAGEAFVAISADPVAALYAERCRAFRAEPPTPDWDFVFDLKSK